MAERLYFYIKDNKVKTGRANFEWFAGFAVSQKQKSIASFHQAIIRTGKKPLEVSTKSTSELGKSLSAFNLRLRGHYLENWYQSGKVFSEGGPYTDLLEATPKAAKRDERLKNSGRLVGYTYNGVDFPLEPKTLFYDYLYYHAVRESIPAEALEELKEYDAFTDIEFNSNRSINTQAHSIAIVLIIFTMHGELPEMTLEEFVKLYKEI